MNKQNCNAFHINAFRLTFTQISSKAIRPFTRSQLLFLPLAASLLLFSGPVSADEAAVTFGGAKNYDPFHYLNEAGQPEGFDIALFDELAREWSWKTEYKLDDWSVTQQNLADGAVDVVPMFISEQRRERYLFSASFLTTYHLLFGQKGKESVNSLYELDNKTVAVEQSSFSWQELQRTAGDYQIIETDSEAQAIHLVDQALVDYALVTSQAGYKAIATSNLGNVVAMSPPLLSVQYAFAVNPQRPDLVSQINQGLQTLRENGTVDDLKEQWLAPPVAMDLRSALEKSLWIIIPLALILLYAGIQLWNRRHQSRIFTRMLDSEKQRRNIAENKAQKLAVYDELTGLPKTTFFLQYIDSSIIHAKEQSKLLAVCILKILDLDIINQVVGQTITDKLIKLEAEAFTSRHKGFIAHLGRGKFGFIFEEINDHADAMAQTKRLIAIAREPYDIESAQIEPHIACGLAFFPENGYNNQQLYRAAELAMTTARLDRQEIKIYDPAMEPDPRNLTLMTDLSRAIEASALHWVYQPKYSFADGRIIAAEMLVRWKHPHYGWLAPDIFIPLAEKTGQIKLLTKEVVRQAIKSIKHWKNEGDDWSLSINVSGNDLADSSIVDEMIKRIGRHGSMLTLEVTETAVMKDVNAIIKNIERLQQAGIKLALDDYGTGYSSLTYLKKLNFDEIKIDMSFIKTIMQSEKDQKIVRSSIQLGQELGASMTAEGVEDHDIARVLKDMNCNVLQGYGISKPLPLQDFMNFSRTYLLPEF
ncbi:MAG: EAL domain-containing protein [Gammaproteobacteria bacterium]